MTNEQPSVSMFGGWTTRPVKPKIMVASLPVLESRQALIALLALFTAVTFVVDLLAPLGYAAWVLYLVPLILTTQLMPEKTGLALSVGVALTLAGLFQGRNSVSWETALVNRGMGVFVLVFTGVFLLQYRKTIEALRDSENRCTLLLEQTNRARVETALQQAQERFKSIFDSSNDGIAYATLDGSLLEINEAFLRLTGHAREEILGRAASNLLAGTGFRLDSRFLHQLRERDEPVLYEHEHVRGDGVAVPLAVNVFFVKEPGGEKTGLAVILRDISDRTQAESELRRTTEALQEKNRELARTNELLSAAQSAAARAQRLSAIGQFAATVAHKIGTPLTALSGHAQLLTEDPSLSQEARARIRTVEEQIERTSRIIQDLLVYARRPDPLWTRVDVNAALQETLALFRTECDRQQVACITELQTGLPQAKADRQQLQEVFAHLIENALQAMPTGGSLRVRTFLREEARTSPFRSPHAMTVVVDIADTGCGIEPDHLTNIFQPFFTTKKAGQGTGLGLAIVQETVRTHGGRITVESEPGKGSRFSIHLSIDEGVL